jgi:hypothetical protein
MLNHVQDMNIPFSPAKNELHEDERKTTNPMPMEAKPNSIWNPLFSG